MDAEWNLLPNYYYVDETYQLRNQYTEFDFYLIVAVRVSKENVLALRKSIVELVGPDWHTTNQLQTVEGRRLVLELCILSRAFEPFGLYCKNPLLQSDRLGEAARSELFKSLLVDIFTYDPSARVFFDKRQKGIQANADERLVRDLRRLGKIGNSADVRPRYRTEEALLALPDVVGSAWRQKILGRTSEFWDVFQNSNRLNSKLWLPKLNQSSE